MPDLMDKRSPASAGSALDPAFAGARKVAVVIAALGTEAGARVLGHFSPQEVEAIIVEVKNLQSVPPEEVRGLLGQLRDQAVAQSFAVAGGLERAKDLLRRSHGADADTIFDRIVAASANAPFQFLRSRRPDQVISYLTNEHPQVIALVLSHLPLALAARVVEGLDAETRAEVATRFATLETADPDVVADVEAVLARRVGFGNQAEQAATVRGGAKPLAELLNNVAKETEKGVMARLERTNPKLAAEVRDLMFVFDDLAALDDRSMQDILRSVDTRTIAVSLRDAAPPIKAKIEKNLSQRAAEDIAELTDALGPLRRTDVEQAQSDIVRAARKLEEEGTIVLSRGSGGDSDFI
jgi:flagellar motor switch protein FliG